MADNESDSSLEHNLNTLNFQFMKHEELIEKWAPLFTRDLYRAASIYKTLKYRKLLEGYPKPLSSAEFFAILNAITLQDYPKNKIFIVVLAVKNRGLQVPELEGFKTVLEMNLPQHQYLTFQEVCRMEQQRVFDFIRTQQEADRLRREPPALW